MARLPNALSKRLSFTRSHIVLQNTARTLKKFAVAVWDDELISISIFKKVFYLQGLWPNLEKKTLPGYLVRFVNPPGMIVWTLYLALIACPVAAYFPGSEELIDTLEPIALAFVALLVAFFAGSFLFLDDRFENLMTSLEEMLERGKLHEKQPKGILKQTKILSLLTVGYFGGGMFMAVVLVFGMIPQLIEKKIFYSRAWYPYDSTASPYFEITLFVWVASMMSGSFLVSSNNGFLLANLVQAVGQFKLLNHNLKAMHNREENSRVNISETMKATTFDKTEENTLKFPRKTGVYGRHTPGFRDGSKLVYGRLVGDWVMKRRLKNKKAKMKVGEFFRGADVQMKIAVERCARHHQAILSYVGCINSAFNLILIQQYSCSVFPSLLAIFLVTQSSEITLKIVLILVLVVVCNLTLGSYCYLACEITEESELVRDSIFGCDWLAASDNFKRSMRLMICRSNQPSVVRVGGFITVSRESYWSVMKLIYTYYMAARATIKHINH